MWRERKRLAELNTEVLLVSFEELPRVRWYLEGADFGFPVLADPERAVYHAYGLGRASLVRTWASPKTVLFYGRAILRGERPPKPVADTRQLGGDFLIDASGRVRFAHTSVEPADRPSIERLLAAATSAATNP